ncbi:MAG TPA: hypothetical protein VFO31_16075 [Vicinamibacterales bacterium]|nr:hypothetical protein [Vicinamibacterales bacterium]
MVLATANGGMYRYGVSDQAFYIPVVTRALDPGAFPRDAALIDAQGHLMLADEALALLARGTGASLETLFFGGYLLSLVLIFFGLTAIGRRLFDNPWTVYALVAAFTLRHHITRTSANTFEPYFHPRMLAFGVGLLAVAAYVHRRAWLAVALIAVAAAVHATTGLWFAVLVGVALVVSEPWWRRAAIPAAVFGAAVAAWAVIAGPLSGRLVVMDDIWLQAVAAKDSLFANEWPISAWATNLGTLALLWVAYRFRSARGRTMAEERGLVWGATALVAVFLITLPAVAAHVAFPVQLQISRVFWLVDLVATVCVVGAMAEAAWLTRLGRPALAAGLIALTAGRGGYILFVEHPERPLFQLRLADTPWHQAMRFVASLPKDAHVLADSGHAWRFGTSVRVSGGRDVFLEETKDAAIAIYSRDVAVRVVERIRALGDLTSRAPEDIVRLGEQYGLTHVVTPGRLPLQPLFENAEFRVYALPAPVRFAGR